MVTSWGRARDAYVIKNSLAEMADKDLIKIKATGE
jgi:hypothetical protein